MSTLHYNVRVVSPDEIAATDAVPCVAYGYFVDGRHVPRIEANVAARAGKRVELKSLERR